MSRVTSVRLGEDLAGRVDALAAALNRPRAWVIEQAILRYVEQEAWQVYATREALDEYRVEVALGHVEGRDFGEVMNELYAKLRAPVPPR